MNNNDVNTNNTQDIPVELNNEQTIDLFVMGIMEEKGIKSDSEELRTDIFNDLKTRLMEEIDRSLVSALPDEVLDELSKEITANDGKLDPAVVAEKVTESGIDTEDVIGKTMAKFREIYLGAAEDGAE